MAPEGGPETGSMSLLGTAAQRTAESLETRLMFPKPDWHQHLLGKHLKIWIPSPRPTTRADLPKTAGTGRGSTINTQEAFVSSFEGSPPL